MSGQPATEIFELEVRMADAHLLTALWDSLSESQKARALRAAWRRGQEMGQTSERPDPSHYIAACLSRPSPEDDRRWRGMQTAALVLEPRVCRFVHSWEAARRERLGLPPLASDPSHLDEWARKSHEQAMAAAREVLRLYELKEEARGRREMKLANGLSQVIQVAGGVRREMELEALLPGILRISLRVAELYPGTPRVRPGKTAPLQRPSLPAPTRAEPAPVADPLARLSDELRKQLEDLLPMTRGRRAIIIGGQRREYHYRLLETAFQFRELYWESMEAADPIEPLFPEIDKSDLAIFLRFNRKKSRRAKARCNAQRVPVVWLPKGYGVSTVIARVYETLVGREEQPAPKNFAPKKILHYRQRSAILPNEWSHSRPLRVGAGVGADTSAT